MNESMEWVPCASCHRHVRGRATSCPFCGFAITPALAPCSGAFACALIGLVLAGCVDRKAGEETGPTTMDESSSESSSANDDDSASSASTTIPDNSAAAVTYAAPSPDLEDLEAQQGTASDTDGHTTDDE